MDTCQPHPPMGEKSGVTVKGLKPLRKEDSEGNNNNNETMKINFAFTEKNQVCKMRPVRLRLSKPSGKLLYASQQ